MLRILTCHSDSESLEIGTLVLGHSLVRSLVHSHRSLILLLPTARFTRALIRSLARSLTRSQALGTVEYSCPVVQVFWITVHAHLLTYSLLSLGVLYLDLQLVSIELPQSTQALHFQGIFRCMDNAVCIHSEIDVDRIEQRMRIRW